MDEVTFNSISIPFKRIFNLQWHLSFGIAPPTPIENEYHKYLRTLMKYTYCCKTVFQSQNQTFLGSFYFEYCSYRFTNVRNLYVVPSEVFQIRSRKMDSKKFFLKTFRKNFYKKRHFLTIFRHNTILNQNKIT